ncbi:hypothetical protein HDU98_011388 [Podochytrium sp. JEL0797]|nr:hypothetical protein HDU98_011388 [Podochytrium sp. JEL0797]
MLPLELQLQVFEELCADAPSAELLHTLQHVLYASPLLRQRVLEKHMFLLRPHVLALLALPLNELVARALLPIAGTSGSSVLIEADWWHLLLSKDLKFASPTPSDPVSESTSEAVLTWRNRVARRMTQRKEAEKAQRAEVRRWSGGAISGWSFGLEDVGAGEDSESDEERDFDWEEAMMPEEPEKIAAPSIPEPVVSEPVDDPSSRDKNAFTLSKRCDGCSLQFCKSCINAVDACENCNAQLCLGCFPPPLNFQPDSTFAQGPVFLFVDDQVEIRLGRKVVPRLWDLSLIPVTATIGRKLTCSSCGAVACAGCGDLEDWMLKVAGYGGLQPARERREQDFQCVDCRDCRTRMNFDYSSWLDY